jgi:hypothetical protein
MGADRIVSGGYTGNFDSPGALIANQITGLLGVVTTAQGLVTAAARIANIPTQTALTNITAAQVMLSQAIPAGALNLVGRSLRVRGSVIYSTTSTNVATITIGLRIGGVTLCTITTAATNTAASTNLPLQFDFQLTVASTGTSGTINSHGQVTANIGTAAAPVTGIYLDTNTAASSAVDLTAAQTISVVILASAAIPSAQLLSASIDVLS